MILQYLEFVLFFVFVMVAVYIISYKVRGSNGKDVIRIISFYLPFLSPAIFYGFPNISLKSTSGMLPYIIAVSCALITLAFQFKDYRSLLNKDVYVLLPPMTTKSFIINEYSLIGSAIFEEIFYRAFVPESTFLIEGVVSGGLFCLSHYIQIWTRKSFSLRTYIILFLLSIVWYYSYKISGTVLPAIVGHLTYNSVSIYINLQRYVFSRKEALRLNNLETNISK